MKKIFLCLFLAVGICFANLLNDAAKAYQNGEYQKAANLWQKACEGGDMLGCKNLGVLYDQGQGVRQDKRVAKEYYGRACDLGDQNGCNLYKSLNEAGY